MTMHDDSLDDLAEEFSFLVRNMQHMTDRYRINFEHATSHADREQALKLWRDAITTFHRHLDAAVADYDLCADEVEAYNDAMTEDEKRAEVQHALTLPELQEHFEDGNIGYAAEEFAVIVFAPSSLPFPLDEKHRSYRVSSKCRGFDPYGGSSSIIGVCLSGKEEPIRLDMMLQDWCVDYCYRLDADGHRIREDFERSHD